MKKIVLDDNHVYRVEGKPSPGVTSIIAAQHFCDKWYAERGTAIHLMCELELQGILDEDNLDPQLKPYLDAFRSFRNDAPNLEGIFDWKSGQKAKWHALQLGAYFELFRHGVNENGLKVDTVGFEIMAYHPAYNYCGKIDYINAYMPAPPSFVVYLKETGKYALDRIAMKDIIGHVTDFLTLRSAINIKEKYSL